jgi:hypothetical protein
MRDAASRRILARISVYDRVNGRTIEQILRSDDLDDAHEIAELIESRIHDGGARDEDDDAALGTRDAGARDLSTP